MENKIIYTAEETSKLLGIGMNKIYELLSNGEIPARRVGRKYLISKKGLEIWLNNIDIKDEIA